MPEIAGVSAGGMPTRVKCLHVLAGQALAQGRGVNPLGDEVLDLLGDFWAAGPCVACRARTSHVTRVAAVDCGTNSIKLLVADLDPAPAPGELVRELRIVRLGQGVDRPAGSPTRRWSGSSPPSRSTPPSWARTAWSALRFVATSAARDAGNADVFVAGSGPGSASIPRWSPAPRRPRCPSTARPGSLPGCPCPVAVLDIGGGSTELILGGAPGEVGAAHSLDIGSVRLHRAAAAVGPADGRRVAAATPDVDDRAGRPPVYGARRRRPAPWSASPAP